MAKLQNDLFTILDLLREDILDPEHYVKFGTSMFDALVRRDRLYCADGFSMSVQMSWANYCQPKQTLASSADYTSVELGFLSSSEELLRDYAEDPDLDPNTVYCYVPMHILEQVFQKHKGLHPRETIRLKKIQKQLEG